MRISCVIINPNTMYMYNNSRPLRHLGSLIVLCRTASQLNTLKSTRKQVLGHLEAKMANSNFVEHSNCSQLNLVWFNYLYFKKLFLDWGPFTTFSRIFQLVSIMFAFKSDKWLSYNFKPVWKRPCKNLKKNLRTSALEMLILILTGMLWIISIQMFLWLIDLLRECVK